VLADEAANLPLEAFAPFREYEPLEIDDHWLQAADDDHKLDAMRVWFRARFCNPAVETPYNGREGGFLFINGGPYDPAEVIDGRFGNLIRQDLVEIVVEEMHAEHYDQWAPVQYHPPDHYDDLFDLPNFHRADEPLLGLVERLRQANAVLTLLGDANTKSLVEKLAFGAAISALEAFLWETMSYWVEHDSQVVENIITKIPRFRDEPMTLGQIYDRQKDLKAHVFTYLQNIVWHRWDQVSPLFTIGLGIELDSTKVFQSAMVKRHDIVHRSGHDEDGIPINISSDEVTRLSVEIEKFATTIKCRIDGKLFSF
jgi:hypothetical protein